MRPSILCASFVGALLVLSWGVLVLSSCPDWMQTVFASSRRSKAERSPHLDLGFPRAWTAANVLLPYSPGSVTQGGSETTAGHVCSSDAETTAEGFWMGKASKARLVSERTLQAELDASCAGKLGSDCRQHLATLSPLYQDLSKSRYLTDLELVRLAGFDWAGAGCGRPWNSTAFIDTLRGRRLAFVGDSLHHQLFEALHRELEPYHIATARFALSRQGSTDALLQRFLKVEESTPNRRNGLIHYTYVNGVELLFQFVARPESVQTNWHDFLPLEDLLYPAVLQAHMLIINFGAWYGSQGDSEVALAHVRRTLDDARVLFGGNVLWREYFATAFTGDKETLLEPPSDIKIGKGQRCASLEHVDRVWPELKPLRDANFRVNRLNKLATSMNIAVVPAFDPIARRPDLHRGDGDCRHVLNTPSTLWLVLLGNLLSSIEKLQLT